MKLASRFLLGVAAWLLLAEVVVAQPRGVDLELVPVVEGLELPVGVAHAGDGSGRIFLVEQRGRIRILEAGGLRAEPFLDLSPEVSCCSERGLLGLAFHPAYAANGELFVHYTDRSGDTVVSRFRLSGDPDRVDAQSEEVLLTASQPFPNHNGGQLAFGPDGFLYIGLGDGGAAGDPFNNAQNLGTLLGKVLRIDVDGRDPGLAYAVPVDNPFRGQAGARGEIWAYGLRNPWRFSFDRETGDLFIGDVGQDAWEEIDLQAASSPGGQNYGWRRMEGTHCFNPPSGCQAPGLNLPVLEYGHDQGCSVTGGFRYRGSAQPDLEGVYVYADFCSGILWGATREASGTWASSVLLASETSPSAFGEDEEGEIYLLDYGTGRLLHLVDASAPPPPPLPPPPPPPPPHPPPPPPLLLGDAGRFKVQAFFRTPQGEVGWGQAVPLSGDTGFFWFFDPANVELIVKVLDACSFSDRFWVFAGGLTNVEVELTVTDTDTAGQRVYRNPQQTPFQPVQDTGAFATCP